MYRHRQFFAFSIYFCVSTIAFTLRHNQVEFLCVYLGGLWWLIHRSIKLDHLVANDQHFPGDTVRLPSKWNNFQLNTLQFHFDEHHRQLGNGKRILHCLTINNWQFAICCFRGGNNTCQDDFCTFLLILAM